MKIYHKYVGLDMEIFYISRFTNGNILWRSNGLYVYTRLINYLRDRQCFYKYHEISTPGILNKELWLKTGHWYKFQNNMFICKVKNKTNIYIIKPMNCPGSVEVYRQIIRNCKDLPLRLSEFGRVYRYESSGALHGLMRLRSFVQDDAHIFCTMNQIEKECIDIFYLITSVYKNLGFCNFLIKFSNRPIDKIGGSKIWDISEQILLNVTNILKVKLTLNMGDGAFYGPKIEFMLRDSCNKNWQMGTIQLDLNTARNLNIYFFMRGKKYRPIIIHRAIFGSLERFIGILLEKYSGIIPFWLTPLQVIIICIDKNSFCYAKNILMSLRKNYIRSKIDISGEKVGKKIKKYFVMRVPMVIIIGYKEIYNECISVIQINNLKLKIVTKNSFLKKIKYDILHKK